MRLMHVFEGSCCSARTIRAPGRRPRAWRWWPPPSIDGGHRDMVDFGMPCLAGQAVVLGFPSRHDEDLLDSFPH
jgi:hypothetical protein